MDYYLDLMHVFSRNLWMYGFSFVLVLSVLVFVHEWGHFIVARLCGVRVDVFSIGFGRELFGFNGRNGTRWKFALIPLGGYVKMFGDSDPASAGKNENVSTEDGEVRPFTEDERKVAFFLKPLWQRAAIVFAGPAVNFLFAIAVFSTLYMTIGKPIVPPVVTGIEIGSAAEKAGIRPNDVIVRVGDLNITGFDEIRRQVMIALDTPMQIVVRRGTEEITIAATPERREEVGRFGFKNEKGYLGVVGPSNGFDIRSITHVDGIDTTDQPDKARSLLIERMGRSIELTLDRGPKESRMRIEPKAADNTALSDPASADYNILFAAERPGKEYKSYNPATAVWAATQETFRVCGDTLVALGQMVTGTRDATELGGMIRIGTIAGDMAERGFIALATFTALLSINLGLINLFPVPVLDGGHLLFYAVEGVKGSPISDQMQEYAFRLGFAILVGIMLFANLNDIMQMIL